MGSVLPKDAVWVKDEAIGFSPTENIVRTKSGSSIKYDFLVLSLGIQLNYDKVIQLNNNNSNLGIFMKEVTCNFFFALGGWSFGSSGNSWEWCSIQLLT